MVVALGLELPQKWATEMIRYFGARDGFVQTFNAIASAGIPITEIELARVVEHCQTLQEFADFPRLQTRLTPKAQQRLEQLMLPGQEGLLADVLNHYETQQ